MTNYMSAMKHVIFTPGNMALRENKENTKVFRYTSAKDVKITGLNVFRNIFRLYGFQFHPAEKKCRANRFIIFLRVVMSILGCIFKTVEICYKTFVISDIGMESIIVMFACLLITYGNLYTTCHTYFRLQKHNQLLTELMTTMADMTTSEKRNDAFAKKTTYLIFAAVAGTVVDCLFSIFSQIFGITGLQSGGTSNTLFSNSTTMFYSQLAISVCVELSNSYYRLYLCFLVLICHLISACFDQHLMADDMKLPVSERQIRHQRLSEFVSEANSLFSKYLLHSAVAETIAILSAAKLLQYFTAIQVFSIWSICFCVFNFSALIVKVMFCSGVNDRVSQSNSISDSFACKGQRSLLTSVFWPEQMTRKHVFTCCAFECTVMSS